jgi:hypothetical protein
MFSRVRIVRATIVVIGLGLLVQIAGPLPAEAGEVQGQIIRGDQLTKQQLEALPDNTVIEFKGKRITRAEIRAKASKSNEAMAKVPAAVATKVRAKFDQRRALFEQQQQAKLNADNQKVNAEFARLQQTGGGTTQDSKRAAIENEARDLSQRYKTASPAEKAQIDKRAGELLRQLGK